MAYIPPDYTAVDFELSVYTAPAVNALDFQLIGEAATGTNMKINIGDSFKDVDALKINIGDSWKAVTSVKQNIGDSWKTVF